MYLQTCAMCYTISLLCSLVFFFFFQAEDGIRDYKVTGVQTCALPIYPYKNFVGNIDGADLIPTGYGIYYPPLVSLVQTHGVPNAEGGEGAGNGWTPARIYAELAAGHPVMAWTETGWDRPYVGYWTTFDEKIKIRYSLIEHVVTLSGVSPTQVRVNDPWHSGSQYWFSKAAFEASWADFNNMAIVFK